MAVHIICFCAAVSKLGDGHRTISEELVGGACFQSHSNVFLGEK